MAGAAIAATLAGTGATANAPRPGVNERMSVTTAGVQGNAASGAGVAPLAITPDGRYVAFSSDASNLAPNDINQEGDVFVHDRRTGKTVMASVPSPGTVATVVASGVVVLCPAQNPGISASGRYVVFSSCRSFDGKPADAGADVWVHDFITGATTRASVTYDGKPMLGGAANPSISDDGRYVAFESTASNLVPARCPEDTVSNATCTAETALLGVSRQVYVRDLVRRTTTLVSVGATNSIGNGDAYNAAISPDGHVVTFTSSANDLVPNDHNVCLNQVPSCADAYIRDLRTAKTQLVSVGLDGQAPEIVPGFGAGADWADRGSISGDDRYVAFASGGTGLVPNDPSVTSGSLNGNFGIYVRDLKLGRTERVSVTSSGVPMPLSLGLTSIDRSGRYVVFDAVEECGTGETTRSWSVAIHDRVTGDTRILDRVDANGRTIDCPTGYTSASPVVSAGGRYVAFGTDAAMLVPGDTNKAYDVFVRDEGTALGAGRVIAAAASVSVAYRPDRRDLFVRLDVAGMSPVATAVPSLGYAVTFRSDGQSYQLRVGGIGALATFELYQRTATGWRHVGDMSGGYGTTGQQVVAAIPLAALGTDSPDTVTMLSAAATSAPCPSGCAATLR